MNNKRPLLEFEWPGIHMIQFFSPMRAWSYDFAALGCPFTFVAAVYSRGTGAFYVWKDEYEGMGVKFFEKVKHNPFVLSDILKQVDLAADEIFSIGQPVNFKDLTKLSDTQLFKLHRLLFIQSEILWRKGQPQNLLELHNSYLTPYVRQIIDRTFGKKRSNEVFTALTSGLYESLMERQDHDFLKLLKKVQKVSDKNLPTNSNVIKHYHRYTWMSYGWEGPALPVEYFVGNIIQARRSKKIADEIKKKIKTVKALRKQQADFLRLFAPEDKKLVVLLREILDSKSKRVDAHCQTYFLSDKILLELASRRGYSLNQLRLLDPMDFKKQYLNASVQQLNLEHNLVVYIYNQGRKFKKITGKTAQKYLKTLKAKLPKVEKTDKLVGELAYPGKVKGRVRVVLYAKNVGDFKKGDILVTQITDPSYIPIMKLAGAVVTDIGGITCHAAIVCRELHKPCIIGTKIATKVFKDGDMVEVDAGKGFIRKI